MRNHFARNLGRVVNSSVFLWLMVVFAGLVLGLVAVWWPRPRARPDAALPARRYPPELLGPMPADVIDEMSRRGFVSPRGVIE